MDFEAATTPSPPSRKVPCRGRGVATLPHRHSKTGGTHQSITRWEVQCSTSRRLCGVILPCLCPLRSEQVLWADASCTRRRSLGARHGEADKFFASLRRHPPFLRILVCLFCGFARFLPACSRFQIGVWSLLKRGGVCPFLVDARLRQQAGAGSWHAPSRGAACSVRQMLKSRSGVAAQRSVRGRKERGRERRERARQTSERADTVSARFPTACSFVSGDLSYQGLTAIWRYLASVRAMPTLSPSPRKALSLEAGSSPSPGIV